MGLVSGEKLVGEKIETVEMEASWMDGCWGRRAKRSTSKQACLFFEGGEGKKGTQPNQEKGFCVASSSYTTPASSSLPTHPSAESIPKCDNEMPF